MATVSCPAPAGKVSSTSRPKPARTLSYDRCTGLLTLVVGGKESSYWIERLSHDDHGTRAVRVTKLRNVAPPAEPDAYDVTVTAAGLKTCECLGFCRWSRCKHSDAVAVLVERGAI